MHFNLFHACSGSDNWISLGVKLCTHFAVSLIRATRWELQTIWWHDWACFFFSILTSKISSRDTSMRQWPAWGCCWDSSWRRILSFWTRSLLYLGTVRHSASSGSWPGDTRACWAWSFSWFWRLEGRQQGEEARRGKEVRVEREQRPRERDRGTRWKRKIVSPRCSKTQTSLLVGKKSKQALPQKQQGGCQETQNTAFWEWEFFLCPLLTAEYEE